MTLGSICDGIGGWQLAATRAGIKPLWSSEIDKFCRSVTARHFPETIQLGDLNKITDAPKVDIITAGTPCQSLSIAGRREGLKGESGLFFKAVELVRRINPKFFVWENVSGAFSSNGGNDFRAVLEEILEEQLPLPRHWSNAGMVDGRKCQAAWRLLDAQYWGVAQRRKRIFLVADFTGRRAGEILFEQTGLRRNSAPSQSKKCDFAAGIGSNFDSAIGFGAWSSAPRAGRKSTNVLRTNNAIGVAYDITHTNEVVREIRGDKTNCLNARMGTGGNQTPLVSYGINGHQMGREIGNGGNGTPFNEEISFTLTSTDRHAVARHVVRRLTPLECERLQGLPDEWTEGISDTQRYKAIGNGMAQPCADFILRRIMEVTS